MSVSREGGANQLPVLFHEGAFKLYPVELANNLYRMIRSQPRTDVAWRRLFLSWVYGGVGAADALLWGTKLGSLWSGSHDEILGVTRVLTLAMLPRWSRVRWHDMESEAREANLMHAAVDVCNFLGGGNASTMEEFRGLAAQFFADSERVVAGEPTASIEVDLVCSLAARELGRPLPIPLTSLRLPIEYRGLLNAGWDFFDDMTGTTMAHYFLSVSEAAMFDLYRRIADVEF